jgi:hypothetical protein
MCEPPVKHVRNVMLGLFDRLHMSWIIFKSNMSFWMMILVTVKDLLTRYDSIGCFFVTTIAYSQNCRI